MINDFAIKGNDEARIERFLKAAELLGWESQGIKDFPNDYPHIMFNCDKDTPEDTDGLEYGHYWSTIFDDGVIYNIDTEEGWDAAWNLVRLAIRPEEEKPINNI